MLARLETARKYTKIVGEMVRDVAPIVIVVVLLLLGVPLMELVTLLR
ncbi:hypothetical protein [Jiangella mangrovi]|uniref:Uncharacterized protein n=1 Tax=Jiangella mangrovi TaxID=1524084 RepID=A0A7W9GPK6_9ACTN|nr:hypothetical protein [Jiangella mangrovi]MBB5787680.1 hypothetical protein [Jiangella mangrovi]